MTSSVIDLVKERQPDALAALLESGVDINAQDEHGWTALCWAAGTGDANLVAMLLERGADPTLMGRDARTPLMIARAAGRRDAAILLESAEQKRGIWRDPRNLRPYCRAYYLTDLQRFRGWEQLASNRASPETAEENGGAGDQSPEQPIVFLHDDFTVTRSIWRNEEVLVADVTPEWREFCEGALGFGIPEDDV
jgi:hypothetical protein